MKTTTYSDAGVDVALGDSASAIFYDAARLTWQNRKGKLGDVVVPFDDFSGARFIRIGGLPQGTIMNIGFDGVGTKVEIAERMLAHESVAFDLFAMVCDDAVVRGAEPVLIGSIFDVSSLKDASGKDNVRFVMQLAKGYVEAAEKASVAVVNGEVAELGGRIQGYGKGIHYNWGAGLVWFAHEKRLFTGKEIKEGDYLVALREQGFRSNGLSLTRKIFQDVYGDNWHLHKYNEHLIGDLALTPSIIYCKAVIDMFGGYDLDRSPKANIHGVAHITGGGIPGKLRRALKPSGLGASITEPFGPCSLMLHAQELGNVSDEEAYRTWNMGQGMIIITPEPDEVIRVAREHAIESQVIGRISKEKSIRIASKGHFSYGKELKF